MLAKFLDAVKSLAMVLYQSRKAQALLVTLLVAAFGALKLDLSAEQVGSGLAVVLSFVLGLYHEKPASLPPADSDEL